MNNELVGYSRAGDVFHYRWAARRCLKMVYPNSNLQYIDIEGSEEHERQGEYVIDVSEYYSCNSVDITEVKYFQLKHTTVRKDTPFQLSDFQTTIKGFSHRYRDLLVDEKLKKVNVCYTIVTNRPISNRVKENIHRIQNGEPVTKGFANTLEKYCEMSGEALKDFCRLLIFDDAQGDYECQKELLFQESAKITTNPLSTPLIATLTALVQEKVLPNSSKKILPEEVLQKFGVTSNLDIFPAMPMIDMQNKLIVRDIYKDLEQKLANSNEPCIIHATGGVGKTAFATYLVDNLQNNSVAILYDCFGAGSYRRRSTPRHRHYDAITQMINELAVRELCDPILGNDSASPVNLLQAFHRSITAALIRLLEINPNAKLILIIDAADNAQLAAQEFSQRCFVQDLLMESFPSAVKIIMLCRTERINSVDPEDRAQHLELASFELGESKEHLLYFFPDATEDDAKEFHRLTSANPRVQINALSAGYNSIRELLLSFGPHPKGVDKQIQEQLSNAIQQIKRNEGPVSQGAIDSICTGLATLPPFIPIEVLSRVTGVSEATIKSFVVDVGRPLWLVNSYAVQFRDEPTETWFRSTFATSQEQVAQYVMNLRENANNCVYISEALPALYLQAGMYNDLVKLALTTRELPIDNPSIARNIRVYRLQYALKAAVKQKNYSDAIRLALVTGEEIAGKTRQNDVLSKNIDLIRIVQSEEEIQAMAYRRTFHGSWDGSENLYSAALLSGNKSLVGEARSFLRSALNWLKIYFDAVRRDEHYLPNLTNEEVCEFAYTINNVEGTERAVSFLCNTFKPSPWISKISSNFIERLIDINDFVTLEQILALKLENPYFIIALTGQMFRAGQYIPKQLAETVLTIITHKKAKLKNSGLFVDEKVYLDNLVTFLEVCAYVKLPYALILRAINIYFGKRLPTSFTSHFNSDERSMYLKILALKEQLTQQNIKIDEIMPAAWEEDKRTKYNNDISEFKSTINTLLPWYLLRVKLLLGEVDNFDKECKVLSNETKKQQHLRYVSYDSMAYEVYHVKTLILAVCTSLSAEKIDYYYKNYLNDVNNARLDDLIELTRMSCRIPNCAMIAQDTEISVQNLFENDFQTETEMRQSNYVKLARAVYKKSTEDAAVYFNKGVELASRFGDEIVQRWEAVTSLAKKLGSGEYQNEQIAYRYIRCAELVGENVYREKYWDRDDAVRTCVSLSAPAAIASLSRWRDREVGRFYLQIHALADELVDKGYATPSQAWPLSAFYEGYYQSEFAATCIEMEPEKAVKQQLLNFAVLDIGIAECGENAWNQLKIVADKYELGNEYLEETIFRCKNSISQNIKPEKNMGVDRPISIDELFDDVNLLGQSGLEELYCRAEHKKISRYVLRNEILEHIPSDSVVQFVSIFLENSGTDIHDATELLKQVKFKYGNRVSVQDSWGKWIYKLGYHYAYSLTAFHSFEYHAKDILRNDSDLTIIRAAIIKSFSENVSFTDAEMCFGFVNMAVHYLGVYEAEALLDFALSRFEVFMSEDLGDGKFENNMLLDQSVENAIAGFIWSALGSPHSATRWRAVHSVVRLGNINNQSTINALVDWMQNGQVKAFGFNGYSFYAMHAKQYLLLALLRIATDNADIILSHKELFTGLAVGDYPHILIQRTSADICMAIEKQFPKTFSKEQLLQFNGVAQSPYPLQEKKDYGVDDTYLHSANCVSVPSEYFHGFFAEEDWFAPLARVFNVPKSQISDLVTDVLINDWKLPFDDGHTKDPRYSQWRDGQLTYHSHGTLPRSDDYRFYLMYHALFCVAGKLLRNMPVIKQLHDEDHPFEEWFGWQTMTRRDGRFISDRRDPPPVSAHEFGGRGKDWEDVLEDSAFLDGLLSDNNKPAFITVEGWWEDGNTSLRENYSISSAFIPVETTDALVRVLSNFENPHDYRIPAYQEEFDEDIYCPDDKFTMEGWIDCPEISKNLDAYDPFAADISYPSSRIGQHYAELLNIHADPEFRYWHDCETGEIKAISLVWCSDVENPSKDFPLRKGKRICVKLDALTQLCNRLDKNLLFEVMLKRSFKEDLSYENRRAYRTPKAKLYILYRDGTIAQVN